MELYLHSLCVLSWRGQVHFNLYLYPKQTVSIMQINMLMIVCLEKRMDTVYTDCRRFCVKAGGTYKYHLTWSGWEKQGIRFVFWCTPLQTATINGITAVYGVVRCDSSGPVSSVTLHRWCWLSGIRVTSLGLFSSLTLPVVMNSVICVVCVFN